MIAPWEMENRFKYHKPNEHQQKKYEHLRASFLVLARLIDELCPDSREKSIAMTELETSMFWANASIARASE